MPHYEDLIGPHGIKEVIARLSAEGASGRLEIAAGETEGALHFKNGKLLTARMGHLTGFQAVNAVAAMRDARYHFDPSAPVAAISSISPSERLVLKNFFGIETADPRDHSAPVAEPPAVISEPPTTLSQPPVTTAISHGRPKLRYLAVFATFILLVAVATTAVLLRNKFRERSSASVATNTEPISTAPASDPAPASAPAPGRASAPAPVSRPATGPVEPSATKETSPLAPATPPNLTGEWNVVNTVNTTTYRSFQNLRIGFALQINQTGNTFTAKGQKISENGRSLPTSSRTPIELKGVIKGDRIEATFSEQGISRKTNGRFVWKIDRAGGGLTGTFASTAARTSGRSTATREL
ncbi:MAG TPA: DUF4388 domain-containing protein [Pyrinomonadaceae bacterium]|nr:DUF4388 domain-containing protein [Pyrinomonadaceae bacterium]